MRDYSGLLFDKITPTDIDGLIEYRNRAYVILEVKYRSAEMPGGQQLALERLSDDLTTLKPTILVVCSHDDEADIDVANAIVDQYRLNGEWRTPKSRLTTERLVRSFVDWVEELKTL